jgi:hypothetical protein
VQQTANIDFSGAPHGPWLAEILAASLTIHACVVSAGATGDNVDITSKHVDQLALALVSPLCAEDHANLSGLDYWLHFPLVYEPSKRLTKLKLS